jgi:hypothetical protein
VACPNAATSVADLVQHGDRATGRSVIFATEVRARDMLIVPGEVTPAALETLANNTERGYADANVRVLGVLPWLEAQLTPRQSTARRREMM